MACITAGAFGEPLMAPGPPDALAEASEEAVPLIAPGNEADPVCWDCPLELAAVFVVETSLEVVASDGPEVELPPIPPDDVEAALSEPDAGPDTAGGAALLELFLLPNVPPTAPPTTAATMAMTMSAITMRPRVCDQKERGFE